LGANTLQTSINALQSQLGFWNPTVGTNFEPALSAANMVQQVMTGPPFRFPWNRNSKTFATVAGTQDYTVAATDFGYLELVTLQYPSSGKIFQLNVKNNTPFGESIDQQQPASVTNA